MRPYPRGIVLLFIVLATASCASQAMGAQDMTVRPARTDGPIYDLPEGIGQEIVCDEHNRESTRCLPPSRAQSSCRIWTRTASRDHAAGLERAKKPPCMERFFIWTSNTNARLTTNRRVCVRLLNSCGGARIELRPRKLP